MSNGFFLFTMLLGAIVLFAINIIVKGMEKRAQYKGLNQDQFNRFMEEMRRENAEIQKDLQIVKTNVEAIEKMMEEI